MRWPAMLWLGQLALPLAVLALAALRLVRGPAPGVLMSAAMVLSAIWLVVGIGVVARDRGRRWLYANRFRLALAASTTVLSVGLIGEIGVRVLARPDEDGNIHVRGHHLQPFKPPVKQIEAAIKTYLDSPTSVLVADPDTGWLPRPGGFNELSAYNSAGIRVRTPLVEYAATPASGVLRLSIFGDSFTNGVDAPFQDTWGALLETTLHAGGCDSEVLNFGVPGYGMDQALLRWQKHGPPWSPHVVVFGLQVENVKRNVNLIRPLYNRLSGIPFSKPRFIATAGGLELVNVPAIAPEALAATVADIDTWSLAPYEAYYNPSDYRVRPWHVSRLATFVSTVIAESVRPQDDRVATPAEETLALELLETFKESVERAGARFLVVHLPRRSDLRSLAETGALPNTRLLAQVAARFDYLESADGMVEAARRRSFGALFTESAHYSAEGNRIVANLLARRLLQRDRCARP